MAYCDVIGNYELPKGKTGATFFTVEVKYHDSHLGDSKNRRREGW